MRHGSVIARWAGIACLLLAGGLAPAAARAESDSPTQLAALSDPAASAGDEFGHAVAIASQGQDALVGAYATAGESGAAYLYTQSGGSWSTTPSVTFTDPGNGADHFGFSVALSPDGKTAFIAADHATVDGSAEAGVVYVYQESGGNWPSTPTTTIPDPEAAAVDVFGVSMALSSDGSTLAVGASQANGDTGGAYVYEESGGSWPTTPTQSYADPNDASGDAFGYAVAVSDDANGSGTLVVGAFGTAGESGAIDLYTAAGGTWPSSPTASFTDPGASGDDWFGRHVSIDAAGTTVLVGAENTNEEGQAGGGEAYTYTFSGGSWDGPQQSLDDPSGNPEQVGTSFGYNSLSADGSTAVIAAQNETVNGNPQAGEAYVYDNEAGSYDEVAAIPDPSGGNPNDGDHFGTASAETADGAVGIIGAATNVGYDGTAQGTAYIFDLRPMTIPGYPGFYPGGGLAGSVTTISGSNLGQVTGVSLQGTPVAILSQSDTQIQVIVPSGTDAPFTLTNAEGQTTTTNGAWSYTQAYDASGYPNLCNEGGSIAYSEDKCTEQLSCPAAGTCVAVGWTNTSDSYRWVPLISELSGGVWRSVQAPLPANSTSPTAQLFAVSCASASVCTAVGDYVTGQAEAPLIESLAGGVWTASEGPSVYGAAGLTDVSCASASACVALGNYGIGNNEIDNAAEIATLSAGKWTAFAAPVPPGESAAAVAWTGVSCGSATLCAAIGDAPNSDSAQQYFIDTIAGRSVTAIDPPVPGSSDSPGVISGVACASATYCVVDGNYAQPDNSNYPPYSYPFGLIDTYAGGNWTATSAPYPSNAIIEEDGPNELLQGASCIPGTKICELAGLYDGPGAGPAGRSFEEDPVIVTGTAKGWSAAEAPEGPNQYGYGSLFDVSCGGKGCAAGGGYQVGDAQDGVTSQPGLLESIGETGVSPSVIDPPDPSGSDVAWSLSCPALDACGALDTADSGGSGDEFTDVQSGGAWTHSPIVASTAPETTTAAVTVSPSTVADGASVTYSATVTAANAPIGSVTFYAGATVVCTAPLSAGSASCTSRKAPAGVDTITASYPGTLAQASAVSSDPLQFDSSTATTTLTVNGGGARRPRRRGSARPRSRIARLV